MSTLVQNGNRLDIVDIFEVLPPSEGSINQYFGRIGSGKTYAATADVIADLNNGEIVYTNWKIKWDGYDQRTNWKLLLRGLLFGWAVPRWKHFLKFPKENLHYFPIEGDYIDKLATLTDCKIYWDEGHIAFDSYLATKTDMKTRASVLHTRHYDRTINVISQRPTAIHVTLRANVNRFFKLEDSTTFLMKLFGLKRFTKTEYQDMVNESVDDTQPVSTVSYFARRQIFEAYDTKHMRSGLGHSQLNYAEVYKLKFRDMWQNLFGIRIDKLLDTPPLPPT